MAPGVVPNAYRVVVVVAGFASRVYVLGDREGCPWLAVDVRIVRATVGDRPDTRLL
ncbi:MAG TPA: hypothetical protein VE568_07805 [Rubrobacter sp.]|nr:hypothetical protein [Rubrobacter sp.]